MDSVKGTYCGTCRTAKLDGDRTVYTIRDHYPTGVDFVEGFDPMDHERFHYVGGNLRERNPAPMKACGPIVDVQIVMPRPWYELDPTQEAA